MYITEYISVTYITEIMNFIKLCKSDFVFFS